MNKLIPVAVLAALLTGCASTPTPEAAYLADVKAHARELGIDWSAHEDAIEIYGPMVCDDYADGATREAVEADATSGTDPAENDLYLFAAGAAVEHLCPEFA